MRAGVLLLAALLLAGCSASPAGPEPDDGGSTADAPMPTKASASTTVAPAPAAPAAAADALPRTLALTSCAGWQSGAYWPGATPPAPSPPSFAADDRLGARVVMEGWECQRLNMTGFERGPVHLLLEYVSGLAVPDSCQPAINEAQYSLLQLFVDDPELAAAFARLGVLAVPAEVTVSQQDAASAAVHQWTWGPEGQPPSTMQVLDDGNTGPLLHGPFRFFWAYGGGVAAVDLAFEGLGMQSGERAATGELQPPMHLAGQYPRHAEFGEWMRDVAVDGSFSYWGDLACTQRL